VALLPVQPVEVPVYCTATTWARFTTKIVPTPGCHFRVGALADDGYRRCTADSRGTGRPGSGGPRTTARCRSGWWCCTKAATNQLRPAGPPTGRAVNLASATGRDRSTVWRHTGRADGRCGPGPSGPP